MSGVNGKVVAITGASSGIGEATARSSCSNVDFDVRVAIHAMVSSNTVVCRASCRAHGTQATTTPCRGQDTRGAAASKKVRNRPTSGARHRRRPSPWS